MDLDPVSPAYPAFPLDTDSVSPDYRAFPFDIDPVSADLRVSFGLRPSWSGLSGVSFRHRPG